MSPERRSAPRRTHAKAKPEVKSAVKPEPRPEAKEGAPKLETPEAPKDPPSQSPRDEEPEHETPETKPQSLTARLEARRAEKAVEDGPKAGGGGPVPPVATKPSVPAAESHGTTPQPTVKVALVPAVAVAVAVADEPPATDIAPDEVAELHRHVAQCPVDAHAPAWSPRTPNTEGGYS